MKKIKMFRLLILAIGSFVLIQNNQAKNKPNIVFILADDLGYNHLSCYGQKKLQTPKIDRLAAEGMKFTQFYAGANVCGPSRTTLMLGLHNGHVPYRDNRDDHLSGYYEPIGRLQTIGELLKEKGYTTGYFGKYGIGGPENIATGQKPNDRGFDEFWGLLDHGHGHFHYPAYIWHNTEKVHLDNKVRPSNGRAYGLSSLVKEDRRVHTDDVFSQKAVDFIEHSAEQNNPFFCFLSFSMVHSEMLPSERYAEPFRQKGWKEYNSIDNHYHVPVETPRANFAGMIAQIDDWVGKVTQMLEEKGVADNTIVIFTSDNGGQLRETWGDVPSHFFEANGSLKKGKEFNYEGGIRVPLIVRWPGKVKAASHSDHIGYFPDFKSTFSDIIQNRFEEKTDGISFLNTLLGKERKQKQHEYLYWELPRHIKQEDGQIVMHDTHWKQAIRIGKWKALRERTDGPIELYNLEKDISEQNDLSSQYQEIVEKAEKLMNEAHFEPMKLPVYKE